MSKYDTNLSKQTKGGLFKHLNWSWVLGAFIFIGFLGVTLFYKPESVNRETGCTKMPKQNLVILTDLSDPITIAQKASLIKRFEYIANNTNNDNVGFSLSKGDRLSVYFLSSSDQPKLVFSACSPGDVSESNSLTKGEIIAKRDWQTFMSTITNSIDAELSGNDGLAKSHIIESIAYVRAREFPPSNKIMDIQQTSKLVVISNFLQNSELLSHYRSTFEPPEEIHTKYPNVLRGIIIHALYIADPDYEQQQTPELLQWWQRYLSGSVTGGTLTSWGAL